MSRPQRIRFTSDHGAYETTPEALDLMMSKFLPASPEQLRQVLSERSEVDYSDVHSVSALLLVLAEYEGHATN
jgi:hypothetical protein